MTSSNSFSKVTAEPEPRERICTKCGQRYAEGACPNCDSRSWEYADIRDRSEMPGREPVQTPLPGSSQDYAPKDEHAVQFPAPWKDKTHVGALHPGARSPHGTKMSPEARQDLYDTLWNEYEQTPPPPAHTAGAQDGAPVDFTTLEGSVSENSRPVPGTDLTLSEFDFPGGAQDGEPKHPDPLFVVEPFTMNHSGEMCVGLLHGKPWAFWTGSGTGSKDAVFAEAFKRLGYSGESKDEADARWLMECALQHYGLPGRAELPAKNLEPLAKSRPKWPVFEVNAPALVALEF